MVIALDRDNASNCVCYCKVWIEITQLFETRMSNSIAMRCHLKVCYCDVCIEFLQLFETRLENWCQIPLPCEMALKQYITVKSVLRSYLNTRHKKSNTCTQLHIWTEVISHFASGLRTDVVHPRFKARNYKEITLTNLTPRSLTGFLK
jgi:hypothetical protein